MNSRPALLGIITFIVLFCYNLRPENPWYLLPLAYSEKMNLPEQGTVLVFYILSSALIGYIIYKILSKPLSAKLFYSLIIIYILVTKIMTCILLMNTNDFNIQELFIVYIPGAIVVISCVILFIRLWRHKVLRKMRKKYGVFIILLTSYTIVMQVVFSLRDYSFLEEWNDIFIIDSSIKTHLKYISSVFIVSMLLWLNIKEIPMIKKQYDE